MIKAILFALLFILVGSVVFALLAPLFFHGVDFRKLGQISAPFIFIVFGSLGFVLGWRLRKQR